jgi:hypothetical protein
LRHGYGRPKRLYLNHLQRHLSGRLLALPTGMKNVTATRRRVWLSLAVMVSTLVGHAQAASLPGFALVSQTQHFSFYSRDPHLKVKADDAERSLREFSELLGQPVEGRTEYFRHERAEDVAVYTGVYATGFAEQGGARLHSVLPSHPHEIVHIVAFHLGLPGDFFQEGLAVALGDRGKVGGVGATRVAKTALAHRAAMTVVTGFRDVDATTAYAVAGAFVEHLIRTRGVAKIAEFFRACPDGPSQRDAAFARVFGRSLDAELANWTAAL